MLIIILSNYQYSVCPLSAFSIHLTIKYFAHILWPYLSCSLWMYGNKSTNAHKHKRHHTIVRSKIVLKPYYSWSPHALFQMLLMLYMVLCCCKLDCITIITSFKFCLCTWCYRKECKIVSPPCKVSNHIAQGVTANPSPPYQHFKFYPCLGLRVNANRISPRMQSVNSLVLLQTV